MSGMFDHWFEFDPQEDNLEGSSIFKHWFENEEKIEEISGSIFNSFRPGGWWLKSAKDPRWNDNGRSDAVGGFVIPEECEKRFEEMKKQFGDPPDDLEWGYMKD